MAFPQPLEDIDRYIRGTGRISLYEAGRFRKILGVYVREARKKCDVVLEQEVERLQRQIDRSTQAPPVHVLAIEHEKRPRFRLSDANVVWGQIAVEERVAILERAGFESDEARRLSTASHVPYEDDVAGLEWYDVVRMIALYPKSEERRKYLGTLRRVRSYRRRW